MNTRKVFTDKRKQIEYPVRKCSDMEELRAEIDQLDQRIVELLSVRQGYMEQAAHIKQERNQVRDETRVEDVVSKVVCHAEKVGAHTDLVEKLYREMIEWCINYEMEIFDAANHGKEP